jgi:sugar (pentulose or hexulose) kinase
MRRVSAIWKRPVVPVEKAGAALGAAIAGVSAFLKSKGEKPDIEKFTAMVVSRGEAIQPAPEDIAAFHRSGGYLDRFAVEEAKLIKAYPS